MIQTLPPPASPSSAERLPGPTPQKSHADLPHVLLVLDQLPKALGGGERIVLRLAAALPQYGFRVSILTFAVHPESALYAAWPACPIYLLPIAKTYDLKALRAAFALRHFLREQNVQIVQTFFESSDLWAGLVVKGLTSAKLIWSRRDMGILRDRKHSLAYRWMARVPDRVFAVSERVRRHAIEVDGIAPERVQTIYNGLDLRNFENNLGDEHAARPFHITTIGNVRRVKGHDVLLRAAALVLKRFPETTFSIAGEILEPDYFAELNALIEREDLGSRVHFLGGVTELAAHLRSADAFVLPSRSEGFSNVLVEAMAASLPVVATDVGGNAEAVEEGVSGWIVPAEDPVALAQALCSLVSEPAHARQMGLAGRRLAEQRFTADAMMLQTTRTYFNLLNNGG